MLKKLLLLFLIALIVIQFFHPKRNISLASQPNNIATAHTVPAEVKTILDKACLDCHSNNTRYRWYFKIQPLNWWLTNHISEGKKGLNFDEYTHRPLRYQYHKLEKIAEQVSDGEMPLSSYTWTHKDARLTAAEKKTLIDWTTQLRNEMKAKYPKDSLKRPQRLPEQKSK
ncbi:MAG: cytochrome C [Chitinophagaceae bacterium]